MSKIMLVEDDNNLREIYEARLLAEGYEIVSAKDGEEALALAVKEKPDLIISDVMMPKISGFDMLDILRSTPETKETKVIMMTALSQAEDKTRADKLGADRYLVKSQVTLEDVANVAKEVLTGESPAAAPVADATPAPATSPDPVVSPEPVTPAQPTVSAPEPVAPAPTNDAAAQTSMPTPAPATSPDPVVSPEPVTPAPEPVSATPLDPSAADTTAHEQETINQQINEFVAAQDAGQPLPPEPAPATPPAPEPVAGLTTPEVANIAVQNAPTDSPTATATKTAEQLANTVNDMIQSTPEPAATAQQSVSGKKVISPISDPTQKPDLQKLAAAEEEEATAQAPIVTNPVADAAPVVTPQAEGTSSTQPPSPGSVVGPDPNSIAL